MEYEIEQLNFKTIKNECTQINRENNEISYDYFYHNYMSKNIPCIIQNTTLNWESTKLWITDNKPNLEYLEQKYGDCEVMIYNCFKKYYNSQQTENKTLKEYIRYWIGFKPNTDLYYLKDWHLKLKHPEDNFYQVPIHFASDWLNEYLTTTNQDDYRFVYMGLRGTWTPFHSDVFNSFSWSANVCGRKRWILLPPGQENLLRDNLSNLPYDLDQTKLEVNHFEVIQEPGEAIFVPSGWYHQVWNLEDTISINHNWVNNCNIFKMFKALESHLMSVKAEISDCKNMENFNEHCQLVLKASYGMDYYRYYEFIETISLKRIEILNNTNKEPLFHGYRIGKNHAKQDLFDLLKVLTAFINSPDCPTNLEIPPSTLKTKIENCLKQN